jgi:hypothetical protein
LPVAYTHQLASYSAVATLAVEAILADRLALAIDIATPAGEPNPNPKLRTLARRALAAHLVSEDIALAPGAAGLAKELEQAGVDSDLAARVVATAVAHRKLGADGGGYGLDQLESELAGISGSCGAWEANR